jgi:micrococcal nuclease
MNSGYQKAARNASREAIILAAITALVYTACGLAQARDGRIVRVKWVADGDTVWLLSGEKVRLIGIDAPETHHPTKPPEPFGTEAAEYLRALVEGKEVFLVLDQMTKDEYGRTLAYLYLDDLFINAHLVKEGYARASARKPNLTFERLFAELEGQARAQRKGMWKR